MHTLADLFQDFVMRECFANLLVAGWHQAFEFIEPVKDDNYFRRHQILLTLYHQETLAIGGDIVTAS